MSLSSGLTLDRVVEAGKATDWHYNNACIFLGFKSRTAALRRFLEENDLSWGQLALANGRLPASERNPAYFQPHEWQPTLSEFVRCADANDWKQTKMAEAHDCSTAHIYKLMRGFGYQRWADFMQAQGQKTRVTPENVYQAMQEIRSTNVREIAQHMGHETAGAVKAGLRRQGWPSWPDFVERYRPPGQVELFEDEAPQIVSGSDELVDAAKACGWQMDMTCWKLGLDDRKALLERVKSRGFKDWQAFHRAHATS